MAAADSLRSAYIIRFIVNHPGEWTDLVKTISPIDVPNQIAHKFQDMLMLCMVEWTLYI